MRGQAKSGREDRRGHRSPAEHESVAGRAAATDNTVYSERLRHQAELQMDMHESGLTVNWAEMEMFHPEYMHDTTSDFGLAVNWSEMERLNKGLELTLV